MPSLEYRDLIAYGLAYISPVAPLLTFGLVWGASGGLIALAYLLGGLCMFFTAKSYAVMTEHVPNAGSVYGIARHCLGPLPGFIAGWMVLLDYLLIPSLLFVLMSISMGTLIPQFDRSVWICLFVFASLGINWFGVRSSSKINIISVAIQLLIVFSVIVLGVLVIYQGSGAGNMSLKPFYAPELFSINKIYTATSICVLSFLGFDAISTLSEEVKGNDKKLVGKAIVHVLLISASLFVLTTWVLGNLMPGLHIKDEAAAIYEITAQRFGPMYAVILAWLVAIIVGFTNAIPMQVGVARVLFAMGREKQVPVIFSKIHKKYGTPYVSMMFTTLLSLAIAILMRNQIELLTSFVNFGALTAFLFLHLSVLIEFAWRRKSKQFLIHWFIPLVGMLVVIQILTGMPDSALRLGSVWFLMGITYGLYLHLKNRTRLAV
ncbi:APC family permease [Sapientia aquatica]|uniref:APC family permease n=1 Tax=Sapientia aquatica TaxID=1549640 RepID=A0A4R5VNB4_9BURK|nr:APC family permease [Sapientia aquatica]